MKNRLFEFLYKLSEDIGPRLPSSTGERRASSFIISELKKFGYDPIIENFKTPKSPYEIFQFTYLVAFLISISFSHLNLLFKVFTLFIAFFILVFFYREFIFKHTFLFKFFQKFYSKNIIVKIPAEKDLKERIIITAHIDSATASFLFNPKIVNSLPIQIKLSVFALFLLFSIIIISMTQFYFKIFYFINYALQVFFALGFITTFYSEYIAKPTNGANDNASSVAILLLLAENLSKKRFDNKEIWLVFTGSEEAGCIGMYEFVKKHKNEFQKNNTFFITLDCTGIGIPVIVRSEGMLKKYKSSLHLIKKLEESAKDIKIDYQIKDLPVGYTEMEIPINFGFEAVTIGAAPLNPKEVPNWHQLRDKIDYITISTMEQIYNLLMNYLT